MARRQDQFLSHLTTIGETQFRRVMLRTKHTHSPAVTRLAMSLAALTLGGGVLGLPGIRYSPLSLGAVPAVNAAELQSAAIESPSMRTDGTRGMRKSLLVRQSTGRLPSSVVPAGHSRSGMVNVVPNAGKSASLTIAAPSAGSAATAPAPESAQSLTGRGFSQLMARFPWITRVNQTQPPAAPTGLRQAVPPQGGTPVLTPLPAPPPSPSPSSPPPPPVAAPPPPAPSPTVTPKTDKGIYHEPALPSLPRAGSKITDPVFGTTVLRLTDGSDGSSDTQVQYSYWPTFNKDCTRLVVVAQYDANRSVFYTFDPNTMTAALDHVLTSPPPSGWLLDRSDVIWSGTDRDVIYGHNDVHALWTYNVASRRYVLLKDFSAHVVSGGGLYQMSKSLDDDVFGFTLTNSTGGYVGYLVWKRSTDQILLKQMSTRVDEVQVDKTGHYLSVANTDGNSQIWNLDTKTLTDLVWGVNGYYHYDTGHGTLLTIGSANDLSYRSLASPTQGRSILPGYVRYGSQQDHFSLQADNENWVVVSRYHTGGGAVQAAFDNEIVQIATDGTERVRRLVHHRSVFNDYNDSPRANISRDGRFVAFTSNWGQANGRRDVFIVKITPAP